MATAHVCSGAADTFPPAQRGEGEVAEEEEGGPNATPTLDYTRFFFFFFLQCNAE